MDRAKILELFEQTREDSTGPCEEDNFLQFLIKPSGKNIDSTFKGKRYKIRFLEKIQMEFGICFPNDFYEKDWSLKDFAVYIDTRKKDRAANLRMARKRLDQSKKADLALLIFTNALLLSLAALFHYLWVLPALINVFLLWFKYKDVQYHKRLVSKISHSGDHTPDIVV